MRDGLSAATSWMIAPASGRITELSNAKPRMRAVMGGSGACAEAVVAVAVATAVAATVAAHSALTTAAMIRDTRDIIIPES